MPVASGAELLLPAMPVVVGWNLVSVVDVSGTRAAGAAINALTYFDSLGTDVTRVYTFDTATNSWTLVDHDGEATTAATDDDVLVGKAYWLYTTKAGNLVP
jgi:hypothetical protein